MAQFLQIHWKRMELNNQKWQSEKRGSETTGWGRKKKQAGPKAQLLEDRKIEARRKAVEDED
jgi:hypothetical protein